MNMENMTADNTITREQAAEDLRGLSQRAAIDYLVGKTIENLRFDRVSDRMYYYNGASRTIRLAYIFATCTVCGTVYERSVHEFKRIIYHKKPLCRQCYLHRPQTDLTGMKFGKLTVLERAGDWNGSTKTIWRVRCDVCGNVYELDTNHLKCTNQCACIRPEKLKEGQEIQKKLCVDGTFVSGIVGRKTNKNSSTGITGVCKLGNKWRAYIVFKRKQYGLGVYDTIEKAAEARKRGEEKIYGDFLQWYAEEYPELWERLVAKKQDT